jgi:hypothetical protein
VPPTPKDTTYEPGRIIDLRTPYGRPLCRDDELTAASYELTLDTGVSVTLPIDRHGLGWLKGIYRHDCAVRALEAVAHVAFARDGRRVTIGGEEYIETSLVVQRPPASAADQPFLIDEVSGSVLLSVLPRTARELPYRLDPGTRRATVPVLIGTFRCGPHELSASQQTFLLSAYARTPGVHLQRLILVPPAPLRAEAQRLLVDVCVD